MLNRRFSVTDFVSSLMVYVLTFALAIGVGALLIAVFLRTNPWDGLSSLFYYGFANPVGFSLSVQYIIPLTLISLGLALCYKAKYWNIGADGQMIFGAIFTFGLSLVLQSRFGSPLAVPLLLLSGMTGGALYGLIPAVLKVKFRVNEVFTTLMLNYVAIYFVTWLVDVGSPWKDPSSLELSSRPLPPYFYLPLPFVTLPAILIVAIVAVAYLYFRTPFGFRLKVIGSSLDASDYAGIQKEKQFIIIGLLSGALAGLAGAIEITSVTRVLQSTFDSLFYGYSAVFVAWLAVNNPIFVVLSGILFGGLINGGYFMEAATGVPVQFVSYFEGIIFISIVAFSSIRWRLKRLISHG